MNIKVFITIFVFLPIFSMISLCIIAAFIKTRREARIRDCRKKRSQFRIVKNEDNEL